MAWRYEMLGRARLARADADALSLERKTACVLAFLALEGASSRTRLAGLLWPDSREQTARNNLAQLLRKLRLATHADVIVTSAPGELALSPDLAVDALDARDAFVLGQYDAYLSYPAALLPNVDVDDCPDFHEWLAAERERWAERRSHAAAQLSERAEQQGDLPEALRWAGRRLLEDATSEAAYVRVMKLQYLSGERDRALATFARCERVLREQFSVEPLASTRDLARLIRSSGPPPAPPARPPIPPTVLRPPVLVGREDAWARMEDAWTRGQTIILCAEPGLGKTRLMLDFAASKGPAIHLDGRPGDRTVPYGTYARVWRALLNDREDLVIPDWVRREFSRLVPSLWPDAPPPLASATDKARFLQATAEMASLISAGVTVALCDDMQYYDAASMELGAAIASTFVPFSTHGGAAHSICALRRGEMDPDAETRLRDMARAGLAVWIDLAPLDATSVTRVLVSVGVTGADRHADHLLRVSNGNPLFLLETVKHLLESDQLHAEQLTSAAIPDKVHALIGERLARLSEGAVRVAQAAAVLQSGFTTLDLVTEVLGASLMHVLPAWQELEDAQIITHERFSHDLVYESVLRDMTPAVRATLHRRAARILERHGAPPARVAQHWLHGNDARQAVPHLLRAAQLARHDMRHGEASAYREQALRVLLDHPAVLTFDTLEQAAASDLNAFGTGAADAETVTRLTQLAREPRDVHVASLFACLRDVRVTRDKLPSMPDVEGAERAYAEDAGARVLVEAIRRVLQERAVGDAP